MQHPTRSTTTMRSVSEPDGPPCPTCGHQAIKRRKLTLTERLSSTYQRTREHAQIEALTNGDQWATIAELAASTGLTKSQVRYYVTKYHGFTRRTRNTPHHGYKSHEYHYQSGGGLAIEEKQ